MHCAARAGTTDRSTSSHLYSGRARNQSQNEEASTRPPSGHGVPTGPHSPGSYSVGKPPPGSGRSAAAAAPAHEAAAAAATAAGAGIGGAAEGAVAAQSGGGGPVAWLTAKRRAAARKSAVWAATSLGTSRIGDLPREKTFLGLGRSGPDPAAGPTSALAALLLPRSKCKLTLGPSLVDAISSVSTTSSARSVAMSRRVVASNTAPAMRSTAARIAPREVSASRCAKSAPTVMKATKSRSACKSHSVHASESSTSGVPAASAADRFLRGIADHFMRCEAPDPVNECGRRSCHLFLPVGVTASDQPILDQRRKG
eukprot:scaffold18892_cov183-Isochrysis_galbana.AAC.3